MDHQARSSAAGAKDVVVPPDTERLCPSILPGQLDVGLSILLNAFGSSSVVMRECLKILPSTPAAAPVQNRGRQKVAKTWAIRPQLFLRLQHGALHA